MAKQVQDPPDPTYGDLIDMLQESENCVDENTSVPDILFEKFQLAHPHVNVGRPKRLYDTVKRIAAPTQPSLRGGSKISGQDLSLYRSKTWVPRVRNPGPEGTVFPKDLQAYGLNEELLVEVFSQVLSGQDRSLVWHLRGVPDYGFYQDLHYFITRCPQTSTSTKVSRGKFYIAIDTNLQARDLRPDNAYRFIEKIATSNRPRTSIVKYGVEDIEMSTVQLQVKACTEQIQELVATVKALQTENAETMRELQFARHALRDVTNEVKVTKKHCAKAKEEALSLEKAFKSAHTDYIILEESVEDTLEENLKLSNELALVQRELSTIKDATTITFDCKELNFSFETKSDGKKYLPAIRKLYYSLLAQQISPSKVSTIIKSVLKCFLPGLDVTNLQLPKERCAGYMRAEELKTVCQAHEASVLCEHTQMGGAFHLNTDGTTFDQKKVGGVVFNKIAVSVNEIPDGTADSIIEDISGELQKLREVAHALKIPNSDSINWTLVQSSSSDSASTQKRFNKLIEQHMEADREKFGSESFDAIGEIVENFCAMHLGCNLRKAFLNGLKVAFGNICASTGREYHQVDTFVHEFYKLFGHHGAPEYGHGFLTFPDFLTIKSNDSSLCEENASYFTSCLKVSLDRQVGSRYFVTAANAARIMFLREAAISFLEFTGRNISGNKLEKDVYRKLLDCKELAQLKADGLMFCQVYSDLVMLAKSKELKKSVLDMNAHYLELQIFLRDLQHHPEAIMNKELRVFISEESLYGDNEKLNYRCRAKWQPVCARLFSVDEWDSTLLYPLITAGATSMEKKLSTYAHHQLPGGIYWDPEPNIKDILNKLEPSNDICESVLGLNNYLNTAIPNMHQMTRSNLIQVKKNKTIKWLDELPEENQKRVLDLAVERRRKVLKERKEEDIRRGEKRREYLFQAHVKRQALQQRSQKEKDKLSELHLITTPEELKEAIQEIEKEDLSSTKRVAQKLSLLRTQINIRKKVLKQDIRIVFTHCRKQRPINDIIQELSDFIAANKCDSIPSNPSSLIGKFIRHKFELEDTHEEVWYEGTIVDYDSTTKLFQVVYDDDNDIYHFDLYQDMILGDVIIC